MNGLPSSWHAVLADELEQPYFAQLLDFLAAERRQFKVFPPEGEVFNKGHAIALASAMTCETMMMRTINFRFVIPFNNASF